MKVTRNRLAILLILATLLTTACVCSPSALLNLGKKAGELKATATAVIGEAKETATQVAPPEKETPAPQMTPLPSGRCFADIPEFPKAKRDAEKEAELDRWLQEMGMGGIMLPTGEEARIYVTRESPAKVVEFYRKAMPKRGWKKTLELTTEEGGIISWEKGPIQAGLLTGMSEGETIILIGCGPKEKKLPQLKPTPSPPGPSQPPGGESLLPVPPLSEGIEGWEQWLQPGSRIPGHNEVNLVDDPTYGKVVEFVRTCEGGNDGGAAGIYIPLNLDVSGYPHLYVWLVGKVIQEEGGNIANRNPKWFPEGAVQVRIKYQTTDGQEKEWYHGFYSQPVKGADTSHFTQVPRGKWFTYLSPDLMSLAEPPARILEFKVYGFGWRFRGQVAQVDLIGASAPAGEAPSPAPLAADSSPPAAGITAKEGYPLAEEKAKEWNPDARLLSAEAAYKFDVPLGEIEAIVNLEGKATQWEYSFFLPNAQTEEDKHRWFFVTVSAEGVEAFREGLLALPPTNPGSADDWVIDSPDAIRIAEENGGARFRSKYPDAVIEAKLDLTGPFMGYSDTSKNVKWKITYCRKSDFMNCKHFEIDATTGKVVAVE